MGTFVALLGFFGMVASLVWLVFTFIKHQKKRWPLLSFVVALFLIPIGGFLSPDPTPTKSESASAQKAKRSTKSSSSKKSVSSAKHSSQKSVSSSKKESSSSSASSFASPSDTNLAKVNADIAKTLKEEQGWANGTLDQNGNPIQNGTPNSNFSFATLISSIQYGSDNQIKVQVEPGFLALTDVAKAQAADKVQGLALAAASESMKVSDDLFTGGIGSYYYYGQRAIGHTKILDHHKYTWYQR